MSLRYRFFLSLIAGWIFAGALLVIGLNTSNDVLKKTVLWQVEPIVALAGDGPVLYTRPDGTKVHEGTPIHLMCFGLGTIAGFVIYPIVFFFLTFLVVRFRRQEIAIILFCSTFLSACSRVETPQRSEMATPIVEPTHLPQPTTTPTPSVPNLQAELTDGRNKTTTSPIGKFDFKNYTYELPRGWQNPDGTTEITLKNGKIAPVETAVDDDMEPDKKAEVKQQRRIGMTYITAKYLDVTDDGVDEAIVVLKIETGGGAVPQIAYVFEWKGGKPELIWSFRTGDRADGGLKDLRTENGELVIELYGQDRFVLGQTETGKITGDEEQLCCPKFFTRSFYKWNGKNFLMQRKRLTFSVTDPSLPPQENLADIVNNPKNFKK